MNLKKTAIALAVAGSVATPMAAQADVYASARIGIWSQDAKGESNVAVRSFASRFGAKGETDLGNGLTAYGRYEWDVDFNADVDGGKAEDDAATDIDETTLRGAGGEDDISVRQRWVGLKGDFGSIQVGQGYWTFYNFAVGPNDNPWWHSGYTMIMYRGRTDNAITYNGGAGDVKFGASFYFDDETASERAGGLDETIDGTEFGVSFGMGDMTLGAAIQDSERQDDPVVGIALSGISFGDVSLGLGMQTQDDDSSLLLNLGMGNAYVHIETKSIDATDQDQVGVTLGYTQSLGRNTSMYYEFFNKDFDVSGGDDTTHIMAVLKYDII